MNIYCFGCVWGVCFLIFQPKPRCRDQSETRTDHTEWWFLHLGFGLYMKLKKNIFIKSLNLPGNDWVGSGLKFSASLLHSTLAVLSYTPILTLCSVEMNSFNWAFPASESELLLSPAKVKQFKKHFLHKWLCMPVYCVIGWRKIDSIWQYWQYMTVYCHKCLYCYWLCLLCTWRIQKCVSWSEGNHQLE